MSNSPIGIFDSGIGGLSVWQSIVRLLPHESTLYIGDHKHLPYGSKTKAYIRKRAVSLIRFLLSHKAKLIVVACNTATVAGIEYYRTVFRDVPIIGVVPVVKTAAEQSKTKHFVVLSTDYTARSLYQKYLIDTFAGNSTVYNIGCKNMVEYVEKGDLTAPEITTELRTLLQQVRSTKVDIIVLGCTHYTFLKDTIRATLGRGVTILDSGPAVGRHVQRILKHNQLLSHKKNPSYRFYTTGFASKMEEVSGHLLGRSIYVSHANV